MFGMSSKEFWEDEPQLYWAYRFSYEKQIEFEQKEKLEIAKFSCWLEGVATEQAVTVALNNGFSKKKITYPNYKEFYKNMDKEPSRSELEKQLEGVTNKDERGAIEFNYWARI